VLIPYSNCVLIGYNDWVTGPDLQADNGWGFASMLPGYVVVKVTDIFRINPPPNNMDFTGTWFWYRGVGHEGVLENEWPSFALWSWQTPDNLAPDSFYCLNRMPFRC